MKLQTPIPVKTIASQIGAEIHGDESFLVTGINEIHKIETGDLTFVDHPKYFKRALESAASVVILPELKDAREDQVILVHSDPFLAYNTLTKFYAPEKKLSSQIHPKAHIHQSAYIAPNVIIHANVRIGKHAKIYPNVVIYPNTEIGDHVIIHANSVIGSDAFYYHKEQDGHYEKWHSVGRTIIEDSVEIGSGCTIDKGVSGDTVIGEGSKLDNQVHIGHGVVIGKHCLLSAQVGIAGKTEIGDHVNLWGQVGVAKSLKLGSNIHVYGKSAVGHNLESGKSYSGIPAIDAKQWFNQYRKMARIMRDND